jgi:aryl-alcohol dehydrogenase-like predicted oxidoreductase
MRSLTRRQFAILPAAALVAETTIAPSPALAQSSFAQSPAPLVTRPIPATGEPLPAVGLGTASVFDTADATTRQKATAVVQALVDNGGKLIDTASTYGDAERVIGDVITPAGLRDKIFIATKLESPDAEELKRSLTRLQTAKVDLLQLHNVSNPRQSLAAFKAWKTQGVCRYIGITSTFHGAFAAVEAVLGREKPDFVQIDYSLDDREA